MSGENSSGTNFHPTQFFLVLTQFFLFSQFAMLWMECWNRLNRSLEDRNKVRFKYIRWIVSSVIR